MGFSLFLATGCAQRQHSETTEKTQLEIREFQTRTFDISDHHLVMKSILNVLQDDGYMVKNASAELGILSATKEVGFGQDHWARSDTPRAVLTSRVGFGFGVGMRNRFPATRDVSRPTHQLIEATVNVSEFDDKVRVRASFQAKLYDNHESVVRVQQIQNEQFYQDFFVKVDKGIFIQQQNI